MFSIHSSWFNVVSMSFAWKEALHNWLSFLDGTGQIVIALNTSTDDTRRQVREWVATFQKEHPWNHTRIDLLDTEVPYTDPEFDGKIKAAALAGCIEPYCILLDCDERLVPGTRRHWKTLASQFNHRIDAFLVPVVDLIGDEQHYKSIGSKWYLHKNRPELTRGVVKWAYREDGSIDTSKSDTCELIYKDTRELVRHEHATMPLPHYLLAGQLGGDTPFVYHLGYLDQQQRLKQTSFWKPVWALRAGDDPAAQPDTTLSDLEKLQRFPHQLPTWRSAPL